MDMRDVSRIIHAGVEIDKVMHGGEVIWENQSYGSFTTDGLTLTRQDTAGQSIAYPTRNADSTWFCTLAFPDDPSGNIWETGAHTLGAAVGCYGGDLVVAVGNGGVTNTSNDAIFVRIPLSEIPKNKPVDLMWAVEVSNPAKLSVYVNGWEKGSESINYAIASWAGTNAGGYGTDNGSLRGGFATNNDFNGTLISNLYWYNGQLPIGG